MGLRETLAKVDLRRSVLPQGWAQGQEKGQAQKQVKGRSMGRAVAQACDFDVVIAGASLEAVSLAVSLARHGLTIAMFDAGTGPGGAHRPLPLRDHQGGYTDGTVDLSPLSPRALHPAVIRALDLEAHGLALVPANPPALVSASGPSLSFSRDGRELAAQLEALKPGESARFDHLRSQVVRTRSLIAPFMGEAPLDPGEAAARGGAGLARALADSARLGAEAQFELMSLASSSCAERLRADLQSPVLRTALSGLALAHQAAGPMTPGSALGLLNLPFLERTTEAGAPWFGARVVGGVAALSAALERSLRAAGVQLFFQSDISEIVIEDGRATGVALWDGRRVSARAVVSGFDMKKTLLDLMNWRSVPLDLLRSVGRLDTQGRVARLAIRLASLEFLPAPWQHAFPSTITLADGIAAMEAAGDDAREGRMPAAPWLSLSLSEGETPAPSAAVLMVSAHLSPDQFHDGGWTAERRDAFRDVILERIASVWPRMLDAIEDVALWLPPDIEAETGRQGGPLLAADWAPDRVYWNRPVPALARQDCPIDGLYLCGPDMAVLPNEPGLAGLTLAPRLGKVLAGQTAGRAVP